MIALNKMDGTVEWEYELNAAAISSPVAVYNEAGDAWIIQGDQSGNLYLLDGSTGKVCNVLSWAAKSRARRRVQGYAGHRHLLQG